MPHKVKKWGNSLAVRIPQTLAREVGIVANTTVELARSGDTIVIEAKPDDADRLEQLTAQITDDNRHDATEFGPPAGREVW